MYTSIKILHINTNTYKKSSRNNSYKFQQECLDSYNGVAWKGIFWRHKSAVVNFKVLHFVFNLISKMIPFFFKIPKMAWITTVCWLINHYNKHLKVFRKKWHKLLWFAENCKYYDKHSKCSRKNGMNWYIVCWKL